jgi:hypothetical protein
MDPWNKSVATANDAANLVRASGNTMPFGTAATIADVSQTQVLTAAGADPSQAGIGLGNLSSQLQTLVMWAVVALVVYFGIQLFFMFKVAK